MQLCVHFACRMHLQGTGGCCSGKVPLWATGQHLFSLISQGVHHCWNGEVKLWTQSHMEITQPLLWAVVNLQKQDMGRQVTCATLSLWIAQMCWGVLWQACKHLQSIPIAMIYKVGLTVPGATSSITVGLGKIPTALSWTCSRIFRVLGGQSILNPNHISLVFLCEEDILMPILRKWIYGCPWYGEAWNLLQTLYCINAWCKMMFTF